MVDRQESVTAKIRAPRDPRCPWPPALRSHRLPSLGLDEDSPAQDSDVQGGTCFWVPTLVLPGRAPRLLLWCRSPRKPSSLPGSCIRPWRFGWGSSPAQLPPASWCLPTAPRAPRSLVLHPVPLRDPVTERQRSGRSVPQFLSILRRNTKPSSRAWPRRAQPSRDRLAPAAGRL